MAAAGRSRSSKQTKAQESAGKGPQKKPLSTEDRIKRSFSSLCAQIEGGHFTNAIKTCDKILRLEPGDVDASRTKLFLLLQTEQYDAALSLIDLLDDKHGHAFERAYSLYRLQREGEAGELVEDIKEQKGSTDRGLVHLEAQLNYREGSYEAAFGLYNELLDTAEPNSEEHSDILTNLQASQKHLDFINTGFRNALDDHPARLADIETNPPPLQQTTALHSTLAAAASPPEKPREKKVRKSRVPKGVIPGVTPPPDPERWLKKTERSNYNQGRRKKGVSGGGATQGSVNVDSPAASQSHSTKSSGGKGKKRK